MSMLLTHVLIQLSKANPQHNSYP
ncbi:hypothetical protein VCRA2134O163_640001 [Vibrio crassostreae]|nr:hypothetical protein VCRA2134O163_640001 [Vibrio crassostreae]